MSGARCPARSPASRSPAAQPILIQDCANDPRIDPTMHACVGDQSLICVPLFRAREVIGTLSVMRTTADEPLDEEDRETLEMISVVLSSVVSRSAEAEARAAQAVAINRFRTLFDEASIGILRLDLAGRALEVNPELAGMLGVVPEEIGGAEFSEYFVGADRWRFDTDVRGDRGREAQCLPARALLPRCLGHGDVGASARRAGARCRRRASVRRGHDREHHRPQAGRERADAPGGDQRVPGAARPAHGPAQPDAVHRPHRSRDPAGAAPQDQARRRA